MPRSETTIRIEYSESMGLWYGRIQYPSGIVESIVDSSRDMLAVRLSVFLTRLNYNDHWICRSICTALDEATNAMLDQASARYMEAMAGERDSPPLSELQGG